MKVLGKYYPTYKKEGHYTPVAEPKSEYVGHVVVHKSDFNPVANSIITFLQKSNIHKSHMLAAIGCDGTALRKSHNSSKRRGYIQTNTMSCVLFSANELPLRLRTSKIAININLLIAIDGITHISRAFSGLIGIALENCHELAVINYKPISSNLPNISEPEDLSTDQQLFYQLAVSVSTGNILKI